MYKRRADFALRIHSEACGLDVADRRPAPQTRSRATRAYLDRADARISIRASGRYAS